MLQAVLGDAKFTALPVRVNGEKRLQLKVELAGGWLSNAVQGSSASCRGCPLPCASLATFCSGVIGVLLGADDAEFG
jgi:hypothetical protein